MGEHEVGVQPVEVGVEVEDVAGGDVDDEFAVAVGAELPRVGFERRPVGDVADVHTRLGGLGGCTVEQQGGEGGAHAGMLPSGA